MHVNVDVNFVVDDDIAPSPIAGSKTLQLQDDTTNTDKGITEKATIGYTPDYTAADSHNQYKKPNFLLFQ